MTSCLFCLTKAPLGRLPKGWTTILLKKPNGEVALKSVACPKCSVLLPPNPPRRYEVIGFDQITKTAQPNSPSASRIYLPKHWECRKIACILMERPGE